MVSSLKRRKRDPMYPLKNRGPGYYYHRGHGYWSKYSVLRDKMKISMGNDPKHIGSGKWKHTHDIIKIVRRTGPKLASPFKTFFNWLRNIWHPFKAWRFTLKLQKEAKERGVNLSEIDVHRLWEQVGENLDKTLKVDEAFHSLYDRIAGVLGGVKSYIVDGVEELQRQIESIEYQLDYGDLTEDMRRELEAKHRWLISQLNKYSRKRR